MTMIIEIGRPAAGKSRFAEIIKKEFGFLILNNDIIRKEKENFDYSDTGRNIILQIFKKRLKRILNQRKSVVIDTTNKRKSDREYLISKGQENEYLIIFIYFDFDIDECVKNNKSRVFLDDKMIVTEEIIKNYKIEEINVNEGFHILFRVKTRDELEMPLDYVRNRQKIIREVLSAEWQ